MTNTNDSTPDSQSLLLKTDTRGRAFTPVHRRETLLDKFERSGLSGAQVSELSGIKYQTFAGWVFSQKRKRGLPEPARKAQSKQQQLSWLETVVWPSNLSIIRNAARTLGSSSTRSMGFPRMIFCSMFIVENYPTKRRRGVQ